MKKEKRVSVCFKTFFVFSLRCYNYFNLQFFNKREIEAMNKKIVIILTLLLWIPLPESRAAIKQDIPYKVYVMLGFHTSFYHSWRGDSNDEAGFGTDIRVVRGILEQLNTANQQGLDAKGYWDIDVYFTVEEIINKFALDIIEEIKKRVEAGLDEVLPAPYNNGLMSAHTPIEFRKMASWSIENPFGTGLKQIFGKVTPIIRPQEAMSTPGIIPALKSVGINGIILPYSSYPFTAFSNFISPLPPEQRYGVTWLKHESGQEQMILFPCYSPPDALNYGSLELWMRELRKLQEKGIVKSDLLIHYNFDADAETWLPMKLPYGLEGLPNTGGVKEIIDTVNRYKWAEFTTPAEYLKNHQPAGEVLIRQDTADGAFDGYFSWAEKYESQTTWTAIEQSRMYSYRARIGSNPVENNQELWGEKNSSFWYRLISLSTTHFGMSTPIINEERQTWATKLSSTARAIALDVWRKSTREFFSSSSHRHEQWAFVVYNYPRTDDGKAYPTSVPVRIPLLLNSVGAPILRDEAGNIERASLIMVEKIKEGLYSAELTFLPKLKATEHKIYHLDISTRQPKESPRSTSIENPSIKMDFSPTAGITTFHYNGSPYGREDFLQPFLTYRTDRKPKKYVVSSYTVDNPSMEWLDGVQHIKLVGNIPFSSEGKKYFTRCEYDFFLYDDLPYLVVDVKVEYPYTPPRDLIVTVQQKLRRLLDLRWVEVGPFAIHPAISATELSPLTIWKHNYLDVVSSYRLDYGRINPRNREIDSFNHQITNGWVAVSNGEKGLLIAQNAEVNALFAFMPMRLRVKRGLQEIYLNPFGTYFGGQLDYSHIHKSKVASQMAQAVSAHMRPGGPSFNGKVVTFRLMLAPYYGDAPPQELQKDAMAFFYPPAVQFLKTPWGEGVAIPDDMVELIRKERLAEKRKGYAPVPVPAALLANPADSAIDLVWDIPRDDRLTGFEIRWRDGTSQNRQSKIIGLEHRFHVGGLENGKKYFFSVRSLAMERVSEWPEEVEGTPGPVGEMKLTAGAHKVSVTLILKLAMKLFRHYVVIR